MRAHELIRFVGGAIAGQRLRSSLSALGVAIGVAAVILLTSLGEGTRDYMVGQFTQFGTALIGINPGRTQTQGGMPGVFGGSTHKLTIDDAEALRRIPGVEFVVPTVFGQVRVEGNGRGRNVIIYGVNHEAADAWRFEVAQGGFLPRIDPRRRGAHAVLGARLARELFGHSTPLGERVRIGEMSLLVVGVMEPKGQLLGFDLDDTAFVPVATAMELFNLDELHEIDIVAVDAQVIDQVAEEARRILVGRHRDTEDFTVTTQTEMLDTFGRVLDVITLSVSGIAGISLLVGAIGILTIMWISVHERTAEIGLLRALGADRAVIRRLFLVESTALALTGGLAGLAAGLGLARMLAAAVPGLPVTISPEAVAAAITMSLAVGAGAGALPARRAARLDPIEALRTE